MGNSLSVQGKGIADRLNTSRFDTMNMPVCDEVFIDQVFAASYRILRSSGGRKDGISSIRPELLGCATSVIEMHRPDWTFEDIDAGWWRFLARCVHTTS